MLKIINDLVPFFEDCYRKISVREYSRLMDISPPTASVLLNSYGKEGLLVKTSDRGYLFFQVNISSKNFIDLSRIYWGMRLKGIVDFVEKSVLSPTVVLFGSLSKAEAKIDSDIDIAIIGVKKNLDLSFFEKKLKRKIQVFWFSSLKDLMSKEIGVNILNGYLICGRLR